jgi:hypothetical protein
LAIQQAKIGWHGCQALGSPLWQRLAVTLPIWRAVLPSPLQHFAYRKLSAIDPRKRKQG